MSRFLLPFSLFVVLVVFLAVGLKLDPREVPSPLIDKPAPAFDLPQLARPDLRFSPTQMQGKVWMVYEKLFSVNFIILIYLVLI